MQFIKSAEIMRFRSLQLYRTGQVPSTVPVPSLPTAELSERALAPKFDHNAESQ